MGKGNREKLRKAHASAETESVFTKNKKTKKESPAWVSTLVVILIAALLVSSIALTVISEGGYMLRWTKVIGGDKYNVTGTMMSYFFYTGYNNFLGIYGGYAAYTGLDTSTSLKNQTYMESEDTWFDYFMDEAISQAEKIVLYCEEAEQRGIKLDDEDYLTVDSFFEGLRTNAAENNMTLVGYISALYGTGVKAKDVRRALEMSQLAAKCSETVLDELENTIDKETVDSYYDDNKTDFWTASFLYYEFSVSEEGEDGDQTYDFEAEKKRIDAIAGELLATGGEEAFRKHVAEYVADINFDASYDKESETYEEGLLPDEAALAAYRAGVIAAAADNALNDKTPGTTESDDVVDKIMNAVEKELSAKASSALAALEYNGYAYSDPDAEGAADEIKWVCDGKRAAGDMTLISDTSDDEYVVTVYLMKEPMARDEAPARNVGHILFKPDSYSTAEAAELKAEEVLALFKSGEMTKEAFSALADDYNEDSSAFYDDVIKGRMVAEFEDWLFDGARAQGDTEIVETEYGYHIMYYLGESELEGWYVKVKDKILSENSEDWYKGKITEYGVTINREAANKVNA